MDLLPRVVDIGWADRLLFATIVATPTLLSIPVALHLFGRFRFEPLTTLVVAILLAGAVIGRRHPVPGHGEAEPAGGPDGDDDQARADSQISQAS